MALHPPHNPRAGVVSPATPPPPSLTPSVRSRTGPTPPSSMVWRHLLPGRPSSFSTAAAGAVDARFIAPLVSHLYSRGRTRQRGQPRAVVAVTGGGGQLLGWLLSEPGASTCLLEALVPYDKHSCLEFLERHGRPPPPSTGFCSPDMSTLLAASACDRALQLTPYVDEWPFCVGVASTATIVSHYPRRGPYRCHAAAVQADGQGRVFTHQMVKGARERAGEDQACALLTLRAFLDVCGAGLDEAIPGASDRLAAAGIRAHDTFATRYHTNAVGEQARGVESIPEAVAFETAGPNNWVAFVPDADGSSYTSVSAPSCLPVGAILVVDGGSSPHEAVRNAAWVRHALGRSGDAVRRSWSTPPAPVFFYAPDADGGTHLLRESRRATPALLNWAVLTPPTPVAEDVECAPLDRLRQCLRTYSSGGTFVVSVHSATAFITELLDGHDDDVLGSMATGSFHLVCVEDGDRPGREALQSALRRLPLARLRESFRWLPRRPPADAR